MARPAPRHLADEKKAFDPECKLSRYSQITGEIERVPLGRPGMSVRERDRVGCQCGRYSSGMWGFVANTLDLSDEAPFHGRAPRPSGA